MACLASITFRSCCNNLVTYVDSCWQVATPSIGDIYTDQNNNCWEVIDLTGAGCTNTTYSVSSWTPFLGSPTTCAQCLIDNPGVTCPTLNVSNTYDLCVYWQNTGTNILYRVDTVNGTPINTLYWTRIFGDGYTTTGCTGGVTATSQWTGNIVASTGPVSQLATTSSGWDLSEIRATLYNIDFSANTPNQSFLNVSNGSQFVVCGPSFNELVTVYVANCEASNVSPCPAPSPTPTETPTPTPTPTETPTQTPTETPTQTPTETPTQTPTNTETPTQTPTNTETPTQTPTNTATPMTTPTPTITQGTIVQFIDCDTGMTFRFGGGGITPLTIGQTYLITGSTEFEGCGTVTGTTGAGALYSAAGVTFTNVLSCVDPICPTTNKRAAQLIKCSDNSIFYALVEETTAFVGATYIYSGECYSFEQFAGPGGPDLGTPDYLDCESCYIPPTPATTPTPTPTQGIITPCSATTFCLNTSLLSLSGYNGTYISYGGFYNCYSYYEGGGNSYGVIYYTGDKWCLSDTLAGTCILSGPSCFSECPNLDSRIFTSGTCISPTPTPIQCNLIDFEAYFECDVPPVVDCDVVDFVATGVTITPTPTPSVNPCLYPRGMVFSMSAYTTPSDLTPTPTPSITPTNNLIFTGNVGFEIFTEQFNCVSSKVLTDCSTGEEYYVSDNLIFSGIVIGTGVTMNVNINGGISCVTYTRNDYTISSNSILSSINSIYGNCGSCSPTATPTPTPSITPTLTNTPTNTVTLTQSSTIGYVPPPSNTPQPTSSVTPTNTLTPTPTPVYVYVYESCEPLQFIPFLQNQIIQTQQFSGATTINDYFQDSSSNCWRYIGAYPTDYVSPINFVSTTYNGNYFGNITPTLYQDCTSCKNSTVMTGGCITLTVDSVIPNQPDSCGGYSAVRTTLRASYIDPITLQPIVATSNINVQMDVTYTDCLETFTQPFEINILIGQTTNTVSYLSYDRGFCPNDTSGQCFDITRNLVGITQILPSNITECP